MYVPYVLRYVLAHVAVHVSSLVSYDDSPQPGGRNGRGRPIWVARLVANQHFSDTHILTNDSKEASQVQKGPTTSSANARSQDKHLTRELASDGDKIETARLQAAQALRDASRTCVQIDGCLTISGTH